VSLPFASAAADHCINNSSAGSLRKDSIVSLSLEAAVVYDILRGNGYI